VTGSPCKEKERGGVQKRCMSKAIELLNPYPRRTQNQKMRMGKEEHGKKEKWKEGRKEKMGGRTLLFEGGKKGT